MRYLLFGVIALGILFTPSVSLAALFEDDFQSQGISDSWEVENINGNPGWLWENNFDNSYIRVIQTGPWITSNAYTDIVTQRSDFSDINLRFSMRFNNEGPGQDHRMAYFRSDNTVNPFVYGYYLGITVGYGGLVPYTKHDFVSFGKHDITNAYSAFDFIDLGVDHFALSQWYDFSLEAVGKDFKVKWWKEGDAVPVDWLLTSSDSSNSALFTSGRIGFGNYVGASTFVDSIKITAVPEPLSCALFLLGGGAMVLVRKKKGEIKR